MLFAMLACFSFGRYLLLVFIAKDSSSQLIYSNPLLIFQSKMQSTKEAFN
jgi:hypothetical protein